MSNSFYSEQQWIEWFDQLSADEYLVVDNFITDKLYVQINSCFERLRQENKFTKAGTGTAQNYQVQVSVRGDLIYWLDRRRDVELTDFFSLMDHLVYMLAKYCFLGINDYEFLLAQYPPGTHYKRHTDQLQGRNNRLITVLIYLNEQWNPADGGQLKIFLPHREIFIDPLGKRLVLFKSEDLEHEVLTTQTVRRSLTGWLLRHRPG